MDRELELAVVAMGGFAVVLVGAVYAYVWAWCALVRWITGNRREKPPTAS